MYVKCTTSWRTHHRNFLRPEKSVRWTDARAPSQGKFPPFFEGVYREGKGGDDTCIKNLSGRKSISSLAHGVSCIALTDPQSRQDIMAKFFAYIRYNEQADSGSTLRLERDNPDKKGICWRGQCTQPKLHRPLA